MANNLFADVPAATVAKQTIDFADAGFDNTNTRIIFEVGSPLKSWVPGRAINSVTGFTADKGYYIVPKLNMDKTAYLAPPLPVGGLTQLNAPTGLTLGTATSTTQPLTWTDTNSSPNEASYKVQFRPAGSGSFADATVTGLGSTGATVTGLTASTSYDYRVIAVGDGSTTSDSSPSGTATGSTAASGGGFSWVDLDFPTLQQNVSVTSHVWTPTTDTGWNQKATEDLKLATGTDGAVIHQMQSDAKFGVIGFRTTHALPGDTTLYTECKVGAYLSAAGAVYSITDGSETLVSGLTLSAGDWLGVFRSGGVWKLRTSTDKTTWTDRATLSPTSFTGIDVYPVLYLYQSSTSPKMYNPQGDGLV